MNNELMKTTDQTPIEIALGIDENGMTTARKLYEFLGMDIKNYSRWCRNNIIGNQFAEENVDYWVFFIKEENPLGGRPTADYKLTAHFAKKLSMMQKTEKGEAARDYFIGVENKTKDMIKTLKESANDPLKLLQLHYEAIKQVDHKADMALDKTDKLEQKFNDFEQNLPLMPSDADDLSNVVKKRVVEILGGKDSNAYHDKSISQTAFIDAYRNLKRNFDVKKYKYIKRSQMSMAIRIAKEYKPPLFLEQRIRNCNSKELF